MEQKAFSSNFCALSFDDHCQVAVPTNIYLQVIPIYRETNLCPHILLALFDHALYSLTSGKTEQGM